MKCIRLLFLVVFVPFYFSVSLATVSAMPHIPQVDVSKTELSNHVIKVKGGKISKGAGLASKIPGLEFLGTAKYIYGIMTTVIGAIMFWAFKFVGSMENKKYMQEKERQRKLDRSGSRSGRRNDFSEDQEVDGKRPLVEKPAPLFGR